MHRAATTCARYIKNNMHGAHHMEMLAYYVSDHATMHPAYVSGMQACCFHGSQTKLTGCCNTEACGSPTASTHLLNTSVILCVPPQPFPPTECINNVLMGQPLHGVPILKGA